VETVSGRHPISDLKNADDSPNKTSDCIFHSQMLKVISSKLIATHSIINYQITVILGTA